jgi:hypothetical protein
MVAQLGFEGMNISCIPKNFTFEDKLNLKGKLTTIIHMTHEVYTLMEPDQGR